MLIRRFALVGLALVTWFGVTVAAAFMAYAVDHAVLGAPSGVPLKAALAAASESGPAQGRCGLGGNSA